MGDIADIYGGAFDTDVEDAATGGFEALPAGWYPVQIDNAEIRDTRAKTGKILAIEMSVIGEKYNGRKLFANLNLVNPNEQAQAIGQRELAAIGQAVGLAALTDTNELLGRQLQCRAKVEKDEAHGDRNAVTAYKALTDHPAPASNQAAAPAPSPAAVKQSPKAAVPPAASAKTKKRPWEK